MSNELIAFLNARLDEDEAAAKWASAGPWIVRTGGYITGGPDGRDGSPAVTVAAQTQQWNGEHIARHDPARALREVGAKRAMVEKYKLGRRLYNPETDEWFSPAAAMFGSDMEWLIRTLAAVYRDHPDHPDYRKERAG